MLYADAAREAGLDASHLVRCSEPGEAAQAVRALAREGDWVLVKGSRAMRMERVVEALAAGDASGKGKA